MRRAAHRLFARHPVPAWAGVIGGLVALDLWCDRNTIVGDSLSECIRLVFHTEHPAGRTAFVAAYAAGSYWFVPHILKRVNEREESA